MSFSVRRYTFEKAVHIYSHTTTTSTIEEGHGKNKYKKNETPPRNTYLCAHIHECMRMNFSFEFGFEAFPFYSIALFRSGKDKRLSRFFSQPALFLSLLLRARRFYLFLSLFRFELIRHIFIYVRVQYK